MPRWINCFRIAGRVHVQREAPKSNQNDTSSHLLSHIHRKVEGALAKNPFPSACISPLIRCVLLRPAALLRAGEENRVVGRARKRPATSALKCERGWCARCLPPLQNKRPFFPLSSAFHFFLQSRPKPYPLRSHNFVLHNCTIQNVRSIELSAEIAEVGAGRARRFRGLQGV
jgi:hypothetical protein